MCILLIGIGIFPNSAAASLEQTVILRQRLFPFICKAVCPAESGRSVVKSEMIILSQSVLDPSHHSKPNPCFSSVHVFYFSAEFLRGNDIATLYGRHGTEHSSLPAHFLTGLCSMVKKAMRLSRLELSMISVSPPLPRGLTLLVLTSANFVIRELVS